MKVPFTLLLLYLMRKVDSKLLQTTKHLKSLRSKSITLKIKLSSYLRSYLLSYK